MFNRQMVIDTKNRQMKGMVRARKSRSGADVVDIDRPGMSLTLLGIFFS